MSTMENINTSINTNVNTIAVKTLQHYTNNWHRYRDYTVLTFFGSSLFVGAYSTLKWTLHRKIKPEYTAAQYHKMVRNSSRLGSIIAISWALIEAHSQALPYCERKLNQLIKGK